jgi:phosphate transport system substrate-binding protein
MYIYPGVSVSVVGGGSGVGISALRSGTTDIAISSRDLKIGEKLIFKAKNINVKKVIIGYDALALIVHPNNKVSQLTKQQVEDVYTGKITNWKDVGGDDKKIILYSRESSSGTYEFFKEHVLAKKNFSEKALMLSATGGIIQSVSQNEQAIAYVGIAYVNKNIKALAVSYDSGKHYIAPSMTTAKNKTYPIARPLFFFYDEKLYPIIAPFLDYTLSKEGQKNVEAVGYVPLY